MVVAHPTGAALGHGTHYHACESLHTQVFTYIMSTFPKHKWQVRMC